MESLRLGKYSDFQIRCKDGSIFKAHSAVVCTRSRVIAAAMGENFQVHINPFFLALLLSYPIVKLFPGNSYIHMNGDEPSIVGKMMDFLYTLDYDDLSPPSVMSEVAEQRQEAPEFDLASSLLVHAKVYIIADKYELQGLKGLACTKYQRILLNSWNAPVFIESACHVLENTMETDQLLRDVIVQVASDHAKELLNRREFVEMLKNHGDIAAGILRKVVDSCDQSASQKENFIANECSIKKRGRRYN